jgi:hypothetical protein
MIFSAGISSVVNNPVRRSNPPSADPVRLHPPPGSGTKMKWLLLLILMVIVGGACTLSPRPKQPPDTPFRSDGCSCFPDLDYGSCCVDHDWIYWQGGTPGPLTVLCGNALLRKVVLCLPV